ncbi:ornithine cyclodeaminase family protein [Salinispira pacifica]
MPLYITEEEVGRLVSMNDAVAAVDNLFRLLGTGRATVAVRERPRLERSMIQIMGGAVDGVGMGLKAYTITPSGVRFVVLLFDHESGELLTMIEADHLGRMRTGAASGVATRYMAATGAKRLGVIGSGWQAVPQIEAVCAVRDIEKVVIFSPSEEHRLAAVTAAKERVEADVAAAASAREAVEGAEVVVTITTSQEPVIEADWLPADCHVNAAGSNRISAAELDESIFAAASVVAVDNLDQARKEAGDIARAVSAGVTDWNRAVELGTIVAAAGSKGGWQRPDSGITIFESLGIGAEDVAIARVIYERAKEAGAGRVFPS